MKAKPIFLEPTPNDLIRRQYFERFGEWPEKGRWEDWEPHIAKVKKALETGKPIPKVDIPDDMLI